MEKNVDGQKSEILESVDLFERAAEVIRLANLDSVDKRGRPLRVVELEVEGDVIVMFIQGMKPEGISNRLQQEQGVSVSVDTLRRLQNKLRTILDSPELQATAAEIGSRLDVLEEMQWLYAQSKKRIERTKGLEELVLTPIGNAAFEQHRKILETYQEVLVGRLSGNRPGIQQIMRAVKTTTPEGSVTEGVELIRKIDDPALLERLFSAVGIERPVIDIDIVGEPSSTE